MFFRKWIDESEFDGKSDFYNNSVMTVRQWLSLLVVLMVPGVNLVMLFYWAFSSKELISSNKVNFAQASVIVLVALLFVITLVAGVMCLGGFIHSH